MSKMLGVALAAFVAGACGHATTTGSASNDWATPTGNAMATHPRYVNPMAAAHPAHDRSIFATREAPSLQPQPDVTATPSAPPAEPMMTPLQPDVPGPVAPEIAPPDTGPRDLDELPPYVIPQRP